MTQWDMDNTNQFFNSLSFQDLEVGPNNILLLGSRWNYFLLQFETALPLFRRQTVGIHVFFFWDSLLQEILLNSVCCLWRMIDRILSLLRTNRTQNESILADFKDWSCHVTNSNHNILDASIMIRTFRNCSMRCIGKRHLLILKDLNIRSCPVLMALGLNTCFAYSGYPHAWENR